MGGLGKHGAVRKSMKAQEGRRLDIKMVCECLQMEIPSRGEEIARGSLQKFMSNSKGMYWAISFEQHFCQWLLVLSPRSL